MAKGIMENEIAKDKELDSQINVDSSGIAAHPNDCASKNSIIVLKEEFGIDISSHKAKPFDYDSASKADIILTMTYSHKHTICNKYPQLKAKTFTLKEYVVSKSINTPLNADSFEFDISDPYGMPIDIYKLCAIEIRNSILKLIQTLKKDIYS